MFHFVWKITGADHFLQISNDSLSDCALKFFSDRFSGCFKPLGKLSMQAISTDFKCFSLFFFSFFDFLFESSELIVL